jgi:hypothetical protein
MRTRVAHPIDPNPIIHKNIELSHRREKGAQVIIRSFSKVTQFTERFHLPCFL